MNSYESTCISYLRFLAMLSIVFCHFLQALDNNWAWVFNVGVQIFFLISGYLYGSKTISDWKGYFKKRFLKIYIPFIVFFICVLPFYIGKGLFSIKLSLVYVFNLQGLLGVYSGLNHLWFLTAIMLCYFITPALQKLKKYSDIVFITILVIVTLNYLIFSIHTTKVDWFFLYSIGYFYPNIKDKIKTVFCIAVAGFFVYLLLNVSWKYILYDGLYSKVFHDALSVIIFFYSIDFSQKMKYDKISQHIKMYDKYSFYVYITHHIFIIGPFSFMFLTNNTILNIVIIIGVIIFVTVLNIKISEKVLGLIERHCSAV